MDSCSPFKLAEETLPIELRGLRQPISFGDCLFR